MTKLPLAAWKRTLVELWLPWRVKPAAETPKLPCPFCLSTSLGAMNYLTENGGKYLSYIICHDCGGRGPDQSYTSEYATKLWNKALRPTPPSDTK